jgi:hypothetical protein
VDKSNKNKRKQVALNVTNMDNVDNNLRADDASDVKDTSITSEEEEAGTQGKTTVSQSGNISKSEQFPRLILTY